MTTSPEFTPGPVSIEKVEEIWTSQSIATTFRFPSKSRISLQKSSSVIRSQNCGAGWQLALNIRGATALRRGKRVKGTARPELVFLPQAMESSWEGAIMSVQTTMIPRSVVDVATKPQSPVDGPTSVNLPEHQVALRGGPPDGKGVRLWSGQSLDRICDCDVTIKVTIVDRSVPCDLFGISSSFGWRPPPASSLSPSLPGLHPCYRSSAVSRILDSALGTGVYFDTKFLVNSKLEGSRKLFDLLPIYAHSSVLEEVCPALDILNSLDFAQVVESDLPLPELREYEYEYGSDSDIDERESIIEDVSEIVTAVEPDDLDQIQSSATGNSAPSVTLAGTDHQETARSASPYIDSIADSEILESINSEGHDSISQAIQVKCAAYKTWRAFIYYCYTGQVAFSPIKSQMPRSQFPRQVPGSPPLCSPKSMYRLADKLSMEDLKKQAFDAVKSSLSKSNIVDEALSYFTSRYPDIQKMELDLLVEYRNEPELQQALTAKLTELATGKLPHSVTALAALFQLLSQARV